MSHADPTGASSKVLIKNVSMQPYEVMLNGASRVLAPGEEVELNRYYPDSASALRAIKDNKSRLFTGLYSDPPKLEYRVVFRD